jgi:Leucine-rich repeat (LRR) protein
MKEQPAHHPAAAELADFAQGRLSPDRARAVERHVEDCPACGELLLSQPDDDSLLGLARRAQPMLLAGAEAAHAGVVGTSAGRAVPPELAAHPRYRIVRHLGDGGMGAIYLAEHRVMQRLVALKVILPELIANPESVERFHREIRAAARLSHPNIVTAYDAEQAGDAHLLVMEYVEGQTLAGLIARHGPLPVSEACEYVRQAALGLQHAHERRLVHRDLKPHNLMLTAAGSPRLVKILDFGLARFASEPDTAAQLTRSRLVMGSPDYMAPEQADDPRLADVRADLYSLGCTLFHLLTGQVLFPTESSQLKLIAHRRQPPPLDGLPPPLSSILTRLLAKRPEERYQTPIEAAAALSALVNAGSHSPIYVQRPSPQATAAAYLPAVEVLPRPRRTGTFRRRRRRWIGFVSLLLVGLLAAAGIVAVSRIRTDQGEPETGRGTTEPGPEAKRVDPDRKGAEWVLSIGGAVNVNEEVREIKDPADLPRGSFRLTRVELFNNKKVNDRGLANLEGCTHLTNLWLENTWVSDAGLANFKDRKNLTYLNLQGTRVSDAGLAHFKGCTKLTALWLGNTPVGDEGLANFDDCKKLTELSLQHTQVSDAGLAHFKDCTNLRIVYLNQTQVSDAGLAHFKGCTNLRELHVFGTRVTDECLASLKDCNNLSLLNLYGTRVSDAGLVYLKDCKDLTTLWLGGTQVSDEGLAYLKGFKSLKTLGLDRTRVSDVGLVHLKDCKNLTNLNLRETKVTAPMIEELKKALPRCKIEWTGGVIEPRGSLGPDRKGAAEYAPLACTPPCTCKPVVAQVQLLQAVEVLQLLQPCVRYLSFPEVQPDDICGAGGAFALLGRRSAQRMEQADFP